MSYGAETWTVTKKEEQTVLVFERELFRRIYGPKYENREWSNRELEEMSKGENIVKWCKYRRKLRSIKYKNRVAGCTI